MGPPVVYCKKAMFMNVPFIRDSAPSPTLASTKPLEGHPDRRGMGGRADSRFASSTSLRCVSSFMGPLQQRGSRDRLPCPRAPDGHHRSSVRFLYLPTLIVLAPARCR